MNQDSQIQLNELRKREQEAFAARNFAAMAEAIAASAGIMADPDEKAGTLARAAMAALRGGDKDRATELFKSVGESDLWQGLARVALLELYWDRESWDEVLGLIDAELAAPAIWDETTLKLDKARILAFRQDRAEEAAAELEGLPQSDDPSLEALWLRLALAVRAGDWEKARETYAAMLENAEAAGDEALAQSLRLRLGQLDEIKTGDREAALGWYEKMSAEDLPVLRSYCLFEINEALGNWEACASGLGELISSARGEGEDPGPALGLMLARFREDVLSDGPGAEAEYRGLIQSYPDDVGVILAAAHRSLESGEANARAEMSRLAMERVQDPAEAAYFAAERAGILLDDMGDPAGAADSIRKWAELLPDDRAAARWLIEALERSDMAAASSEISRLAEAAEDGAEKLALLVRKAEISSLVLGDQAAALGAYQEALGLPMNELPLVLASARLQHRGNDFEALAASIEKAMEIVTDAGSLNVYRAWLANVSLARLNDPDRALEQCEKILEEDLNAPMALRNKARALRRKSDWAAFVEAQDRIVASMADPALAAAAKDHIAWVCEVKLQDRGRARTLYQEIKDRDGGFALEALRRLNFAGGDHAGYAAILEGLVDPESQGPLRASRLARLASAREALGELSEAWAALEKARVTFMGRPHLFVPMIDLAQQAGYWGRYQSLVEEFSARLGDGFKRALLWESAWAGAELPDQGEEGPAALQRAMLNLAQMDENWRPALRGAWFAAIKSGDDKARSDLLVRMTKAAPEDQGLLLRLRLGYLLRDNLGANEESIATLRQVLAKDQKSAPVIRELSLMYEEAGQWGELIRMMLLELPLRKERDVLIDIYTRLADLYEKKFKALDEAIKCMNAVIRMAPRKLDAHRELIRLLEAKGRFADMVKAILAAISVTEDTGEKVKLYVRAASVYDEKLNAADHAITCLKKALDLDPSRPETFAALQKIYEREQRWQELVDILLGQVGRVEDPLGKASLHEQAADIQENKMAQPDQAIDNLVVARDLDPGRQSVLLSLERLFTARERWEELIDTLERLAEPADDQARLEYYSRIGALWDEKAGNLPNAVQSWERARDIDAANVRAHEALVSLYERTGDDALYVERTKALAELVAEDKARAVGLLCKAGQVQEGKLGSQDDALATYGRAMDVDDTAPAPVALAKDLRAKREEWPEVIELLLREERINEDRNRKLELFTEAGTISEHKLEDAAAASGYYRQALDLKADYLPAVKPQAEIHFKGKDYASARPLYETWTAALGEETVQKQAEVWFRAGWCAEQGGAVDDAMARYHKSAEAVPKYKLPLDRLSELYTKQEKWEQASAFTARVLEVAREAGDNNAMLKLLLRQGHIEEKQGLLDKAADALEQALAIKPGDYETLKKLVDLYYRLENWNKVLVNYDLAIKSAPTVRAQSEDLTLKGEVLEDKLDQEKSALAHFQAAADRDQTNLRAWKRLAAIHLRNQTWSPAEGALIKVLELEPEEANKVRQNYDLGRVYMEGLEDLEKAKARFEAALAIDKMHVPSMQLLGDIYLKLEEWQKYIDTMEEFLRVAEVEDKAQLAPIYTKMGIVYRDHIGNTERAIINFQQVSKIDPDNEEARAELAALYISDPKFVDQAKAENLNIIRMQPFRVQTYRDLANIYKSQNNYDAQFWIFSILSRLDSLEYEEEMFYEANQSKVRKSSKRAIKDIDRQGYLLHPDEKGVMRDMLVSVGPYMQKQFPPPLTKYGASKSNELSENSKSPILEIAAELHHNLGSENGLAIHLIPGLEQPTVMNNGNVDVMLIGTEWFNRFKKAEEQRFVVGKLLEHLINYHGMVMHANAEQLFRQLSLIALAYEQNLQIQIPGLDPGEQEKQKKAAKKLVPRKVRAHVEHVAQRFTRDVVDLDIESFKKAMEHTANRAGLLVCGDLTAAMNAVIKMDPNMKNVDIDNAEDQKAIWAKNEYCVEMLSYSMSDSFFRIRERAGFSLV